MSQPEFFLLSQIVCATGAGVFIVGTEHLNGRHDTVTFCWLNNRQIGLSKFFSQQFHNNRLIGNHGPSR
jgi:hypothetical protein